MAQWLQVVEEKNWTHEGLSTTQNCYIRYRYSVVLDHLQSSIVVMVVCVVYHCT